MSQFRQGVDVYARMAERLYGGAPGSIAKGDPRRALGKVAVLGLGYQMGAPRFRLQAERDGIDWSSVPLTPEETVDRWRDANPRVAGTRCPGASFRQGGLWQRMNAAAKATVRGAGARSVGAVTWRMQGADLLCILPSGR